MGTYGISTRRLVAATTGLAIALAAAPLGALHSQTPQDSAARRTNPVDPTKWPTPPTTTPPAANPTTTAQGQRAVAADSTFIREASAGNLLEVRLGTIALQKASDPAVKQFAQRMVTDHTTMGQQWAALVAKSTLPIKAALDPTQQQAVTRLAVLSGPDFDRAYMSAMVQDHQQDVDTFQRLGPSAQSPEVRNLAASGLAMIQQHLSLAQQVASQVGATSTVATHPAYPQAPAPSPTSPVTVPAARPQLGKGSADVRADAQYVREVAYGHILEARLAQMAQQRARDPKVKQFADRMAANFSNWQDRWTDLASNNGIQVNPNMGPLHREKIARLQKASKGQFDRVYLDIVTENLGSIVPYFQKEGRAAQSSKVRNLVQDELPMIQQHLAEAQRLNRQAQADAKSDKARSLSNKK